jgi:Zn finger protein HypA/HybF involved in hydrogenase expression
MFCDTYRCRPCGHKFTHEHKNFWLGPLPPSIGDGDVGRIDLAAIEAFLARHTRNLFCPTCHLEVSIPSLLDRESWLDWCAHESGFRRYPFLVGLAVRIDSTFSGEPWNVDIGSISCPYCSTILVLDRFQPTCPQCGGSDLDHIGDWHAQTRDTWPPIV